MSGTAPFEIRGDYLIDTNVLIYSTLEADPRHQRGREVIDARLKQQARAFISAQNLAEMYPNLTGPKTQPPDPPHLARTKIEAIARLRGITILPVTRAVVEKALGLCGQYNVTRQRFFDMQIAAVMQIHGIQQIITENDEDFREIEGIKAINPFT
jgi:predicted nucleic acid-binding protein